LHRTVGSGVINYFMCDDCTTEPGRVADAGGQVVRVKMDIGEYGFIVLVTDTEGSMVGLHSMVQAAGITRSSTRFARRSPVS